jgi:hypothetical protein
MADLYDAFHMHRKTESNFEIRNTVQKGFIMKIQNSSLHYFSIHWGAKVLHQGGGKHGLMDISLGVSRIDSLFFGKMMADMW